MLPTIFGSGGYINRGQAWEQRNSVHRLSLAFHLHRRVADNGLQRHVNFMYRFSSWSSLGLKFWHLCPFVGDVLGGPLKYVNVVCLIMLVEINYYT
eukprot:CCRYP_017985-RA/>CCRYP_017985-RA protein AED:0.00 eAED:0.00 QI:142/1/0.75/1/0/0/4/0/95